jgi:4-phytase/acid phosphatase
MRRVCAAGGLLLSLLISFPVVVFAAGAPRLKFVVILTRHGVRAPTWETSRLNRYSAQAWPDWGVPPADLTPRGRRLMTLMGGYYSDWLAREQLIDRQSCASASQIYIWADTDQRTLETGRALAEGLLPKCETRVHSFNGKDDPLFDPIAAGVVKQDEGASDRAAALAKAAPASHREAFSALGEILSSGSAAQKVDTLNTASTLTENLLLEYANGFEGKELGWGRLNERNLFQVLKLHTVYADLMRRTPALARRRGGNMLSRIVSSIDQAVRDQPVAGAIGQPGSRVVVISGHDTNLSNVSGLLDLSWEIPGYQPDDTPPGGALVFSLWQDPGGGDFVRMRYVVQTLAQMRGLTPLTLAAPPAGQDVAIPGCKEAATSAGCPWPVFERMARRALGD